MTPIARRVVQAVLYEAIAVAFVGPALGLVFNEPAASTFALAVFMSAVALGWNYLFNLLFECWEARQTTKGRSIWRRLAHAVGFEGGLVVMLVPVMAYWLNTTLLNALLADLGILAFFFVYAIGFTWAFDRVFGLPQSAAAPCEAPNPSLERTANGMAPWPRGAEVHVAPRGQGAMPPSAAQLKR